MIEIPVYDKQGNVQDKVQFDETCLGKFVNMKLLHAAIVTFQANQRLGTVNTRGVREVVGRTTKPYRQKGTGRARMGTPRRVGSRGGATCHGPKPRDYSLSMPKKARRAALKSALLGKFRDGEIIVINELKAEQPKTKEMATTLKNLKINGGCLVVTKDRDENTYKSFRNLPKTDFSNFGDLHAYGVLLRKHVLITKDVLDAISQEMK
jgi:large subunit ribosomal protein L4